MRGRGDDGCRQKCHSADIDMVLMKPVESSLIQSILTRAHEHVNRSRTGRHVAALSAAEFAQQAAAVAAAAAAVARCHLVQDGRAVTET